MFCLLKALPYTMVAQWCEALFLNLEFWISGAPSGKFWGSEKSHFFKKISELFHFWVIEINASLSNLEDW